MHHYWKIQKIFLQTKKKIIYKDFSSLPNVCPPINDTMVSLKYVFHNFRAAINKVFQN